MAGTKEGAMKARATILKNHGPDFYKKISKKGGKAQVPKGFAKMVKKKIAAAGQKGGSISRRGKTLDKKT